MNHHQRHTIFRLRYLRTWHGPGTAPFCASWRCYATPHPSQPALMTKSDLFLICPVHPSSWGRVANPPQIWSLLPRSPDPPIPITPFVPISPNPLISAHVRLANPHPPSTRSKQNIPHKPHCFSLRLCTASCTSNLARARQTHPGRPGARTRHRSSRCPRWRYRNTVWR